MFNRRKKYLILTTLIIGCLQGNIIFAAPTQAEIDAQSSIINKQDIKNKEKESEKDRDIRINSKTVSLKEKIAKDKKIVLPEETPSFYIEKIILDGENVEKFPWVNEFLDKFKNQKIGFQGINIIAKSLTEEFMDRGYVTTRVLVKEQDLTGKQLKLTLIPGKIRTIKFEDNNPFGTWHNAFPTKPGDILNIRNLEQGLEQMKRVPSQDVDIKIAPGDNPGESDIILSVKRDKQYRTYISMDDSGTESTGKIQSTITFSVDNLLGLNDLFNVSINKDAMKDDEKFGTRGNSIYYSIPYGNATFSFSKSYNNYHQTVENAINPFLSSGKSETTQFGVKHLLSRDQKQKTNLDVSIIKKKRRSYIDDTEIQVQRQDTTALKIGIEQRKYIGKTTIDSVFEFKQGVPWLGAEAGPTDDVPGEATTQYKIWLLDTTLTTPMKLGDVNAQYKMNFRAQRTNNRIYGSEFFSIGGRYTVRGFDGEQNLSAESGWLIQNEIAIPLVKANSQFYIGIDYGRVSGPSTEYLLGKDLLGTAIGFRGSVGSCQYDVFAGWAIKKPEGYKTANPAFGFQFVFQL